MSVNHLPPNTCTSFLSMPWNWVRAELYILCIWSWSLIEVHKIHLGSWENSVGSSHSTGYTWMWVKNIPWLGWKRGNTFWYGIWDTSKVRHMLCWTWISVENQTKLQPQFFQFVTSCDLLVQYEVSFQTLNIWSNSVLVKSPHYLPNSWDDSCYTVVTGSATFPIKLYMCWKSTRKRTLDKLSSVSLLSLTESQSQMQPMCLDGFAPLLFLW